MTGLLDTHTVLWATLQPSMLSQAARDLIVDQTNSLLVSAVTAYEIANKSRRGNLPEAEDLERNFLDRMEEAGFVVLPVNAEIALRAGRLIGQHKDPWDRLIAAQALALDIPVISNDGQLDSFGIRRIW